ncbi:subtilisin-like serine protease [Trifolium pratense]|uniref:Subtilisin-like serine protease n=1 Tax=Trifolium pratense TaxID=57577 RepID=A0A2K3PG90_TRIPR|nr:subtilisin-like serine protease [Trifolium pratense]
MVMEPTHTASTAGGREVKDLHFDGVDVITISIGLGKASDFVSDPIAIGSFHAMEKGILTTHVVGKVMMGPNPSSVGSAAPCLPGRMCACIDKKFVKGKLVLCGAPAVGVRDAYENGAIGSIINVTHSHNDVSFVTSMPSLKLDTEDYVLVQSYTNSTKYPVAEILKSDIFHDTTAPRIVSFFSRGPNHLVPEIMKPDISAPGVDILASYSPLARVTLRRYK